MGLRILGKWKKMRDTFSNQMAIGLSLSSDWLFYKPVTGRRNTKQIVSHSPSAQLKIASRGIFRSLRFEMIWLSSTRFLG